MAATRSFSQVVQPETSQQPPTIAYCVTCNAAHKVHHRLIGQRFDCPYWSIESDHIAAVIQDKWSAKSWLRLIALFEYYHTRRNRCFSSTGLANLFFVAVAFLLCCVTSPSVWACIPATFLIADALISRTASVYASQRPRLPFRLLVFGIMGLVQLALSFGVIYSALFSCSSFNESPGNGLGYAYFSFVTLATVGYGDIAPNPKLPFVGDVQALRLLIIIEIICGLYYLTVLLAAIVSWTRGVERPRSLCELLTESTKLDEIDRAWKDGFEVYLALSKSDAEER